MCVYVHVIIRRWKRGKWRYAVGAEGRDEKKRKSNHRMRAERQGDSKGELTASTTRAEMKEGGVKKMRSCGAYRRLGGHGVLIGSLANFPSKTGHKKGEKGDI